MPKPTYVAPSREGLVPLTVYVKPEIRQALKVAAAQHSITVTEIMDSAIANALKKYAKAKDRTRSLTKQSKKIDQTR